MRDLIRYNYICEVCKLHTVQLKKTIKGKQKWVCKECHTVQDEKEK